MRNVWVSGSVVLLMAATACSVQIGSGAGGARTTPPRRAAAAPAPAPRPAAKPAQASAASPAPAARTAPAAKPAKPAKGSAATARAMGRRGAAPAPVPRGSAPAPMQVSPDAIASAVGFNGALNVAKLQALKARNPKSCGMQEVAPGTWVRIDCQLYKPSAKAVPHLSPRKARMVDKHQTMWKPLRLTSAQMRAALTSMASGGRGPGASKKPVLDKTGPGGGGDGNVTTESFPETVDHRTTGLVGPVKDQGPVGSCTAFSLSTAIDNAAIRAGKMTARQATLAASPSHVWSSYGYPQMGIAADANVGRNIATLATWSQDNRETCKLSSPMAGEECGEAFQPSVRPGSWRSDPKLVAKYDSAQASGAYKIASLEKLQTLPPKIDELVQALASGAELWIAMKIDGYAWSSSKIKSNKGVIPDWNSYAGGHAVTMAGYRETPSGRQYLIHNSWGTSWGDKGYAWVNEAMVMKYMHYAYRVKLSGGVKPEDLTDEDCAPDELVDVGLGVCGLICPDDTRPNKGCGKKK